MSAGASHPQLKGSAGAVQLQLKFLPPSTLNPYNAADHFFSSMICSRLLVREASIICKPSGFVGCQFKL